VIFLLSIGQCNLETFDCKSRSFFFYVILRAFCFLSNACPEPQASALSHTNLQCKRPGTTSRQLPRKAFAWADRQTHVDSVDIAQTRSCRFFSNTPSASTQIRSNPVHSRSHQSISTSTSSFCDPLPSSCAVPLHRQTDKHCKTSSSHNTNRLRHAALLASYTRNHHCLNPRKCPPLSSTRRILILSSYPPHSSTTSLLVSCIFNSLILHEFSLLSGPISRKVSLVFASPSPTFVPR
jgi:hypothetical protein